jgi:hypothetical protein
LESTKEAIRAERQQHEACSEEDLLLLLDNGQGDEVADTLIFFTPPGQFAARLDALRRGIEAKFATIDRDLQKHHLRFLAEVSLSLRSFLPRWNLQNAERHPGGALADAQLEAEAGQTRALLTRLAAGVPPAAEQLLAEWLVETTARLKAEAVPDPTGEAEKLVGRSVDDYLDHVGAGLARSNLRRIAELRNTGQTRTEISNDYAAFTRYARYLGASFVTTNPPLVDWAWTALPEQWTPVVDAIITSHPEDDDDSLARLVTLEVVLSNMRLMRPIFLLTDGQMGCVTLQLNPKKHGDAKTMLADAMLYYAGLQERLNGGVPNVVFKLPGTQAGLKVCEAITDHGVGVTITVNFGLFQHLPFARVIHQKRRDIFSCLAHMSGRLAFPVRDELLGKLDQLAAHGITEAQAREAAAWSGVAVLKRLQRLLLEKGYDLADLRPLVASLRIYTGAGYENLPNAFPDITETLGTSLISVFPNVRRPFDAQPLEMNPHQVDAPLPDGILDVLRHSEIFKQAYYVADREWVAKEDERFRPAYVLALTDEAGTAAWTPARDTLAQFCDSYDTFVQRIVERKRRLLGR